MTEECCLGLAELKKQYEKLRKKYNLPSFEALNQDFEIEKLQERETELLLREIRRNMIDKNLAYLRFVEMFLNPTNAPMFFLALTKTLSNGDKKTIEELYAELGKNELKSVARDNEYDENEEAKFIKKFFEQWQKIKEKFSGLMIGVEKAWEKKSEKAEKGYLG